MMAADPNDRLHRRIDHLSDQEASERTTALQLTGGPEPLSEEDILLPEAILPDEESADAMIATIRRWRRD